MGAPRAQAQISLAVAINRTARMRALSQRGVKLYAQLMLDVQAVNTREAQAAVQKLIALSLDDLGRANLSGALAAQLATTSKTSATFLASLGAAPSKENLVRANSHADRLLAESDALTSLLEAASKQNSGKLINLAGRQRMLSQRMAKQYFLAAAGADSPGSRSLLATDRADFKQALKTLSAAPVSTPGIRNDLQMVEAQWLFFETALDRKADAESLKNIATTSERLLELNNNLTTQYETALRDVLGVT